MIYNTQTPYIASYIIVRRDGKIAFVLRSHTAWMNGYYGLPSGKVEKQEAYKAAAVREAKEEIGIAVKEEDLEPVLVMHRNSDENMEWVDIYFEVKAWEGEPINAEPDKHSEIAWLDSTKLPENVIACVKFALEQIAIGNHYCEYGWTTVGQ